MARRCPCTQSDACAQTAVCGAQTEEEMTMCHYGASVTDDAACDAGRQLCLTNRILESINDVLALILLELQRQNGTQER